MALFIRLNANEIRGNGGFRFQLIAGVAEPTGGAAGCDSFQFGAAGAACAPNTVIRVAGIAMPELGDRNQRRAVGGAESFHWLRHFVLLFQ